MQVLFYSVQPLICRESDCWLVLAGGGSAKKHHPRERSNAEEAAPSVGERRRHAAQTVRRGVVAAVQVE